MPLCVAFGGGGVALNARRARIAELLDHEGVVVEERVCELFKVEQLVNELVKNPAFREEMRLKAQQRLEKRRDLAFQTMQQWALARAYDCGGNKFLCAWREQASSELQQLRETERWNREHRTREEEDKTFVAARIDMTCEITGIGESRISNMSSQLMEEDEYYISREDMSTVLPITTPKESARGYTIPLVVPGKRFSLGEMPQIRCKPEHYPWLKDCVRLGPVKSSSCYDGEKLRSWGGLAHLMWASR